MGATKKPQKSATCAGALPPSRYAPSGAVLPPADIPAASALGEGAALRHGCLKVGGKDAHHTAGPEVSQAPRLDVPPSLLACQVEPEVPAPLRDDAELAYWIVDLTAAGRDCRAKLAAVAHLVEAQKGARVP